MTVKSEDGESIESESLEKYERILSKEKLASMKKASVLLALFMNEIILVKLHCLEVLKRIMRN